MRSHRTDGPNARSGEPARPDRRPQRRDAAASAGARTTAASIIALQRAVGNRVVAQWLPRGSTVASAPVVQRAAYGLDTSASKNAYLDRAVKLWKTAPGMSLKDFANDLLKTIGAELKGHGVPLFGWTFGSGAGAAGIFDSKAWKVQVNVSKFSGRTTPKTLKDLTVDELTEVVGTLYHESRHADQDVLIIRALLDQKKTVDQVFASTQMRRDVIKAVSATKYTNALDADQIAHAGRMFDVMYGAHKEFLEFLLRHSAAVDALAELAKPGSRLSAAASHLKTLSSWQSSVLQPKLKKMAAMKSRTPVETDLLHRLQDVDAALTDLRASWNTVSGVKKPVQADVEDVRTRADDAVAAIVDAYKNLEGEADAFRVEEEIKTAFGQRAAKKP